jgi:hypothetical protein
MSDKIEDLVERLLDWPYQGETMAEEAAVLIKQLTAERDRLRALAAVQLDAAVKAERKRCAKLAEVRSGYSHDGVDIAKAIRKGEQP